MPPHLHKQNLVAPGTSQNVTVVDGVATAEFSNLTVGNHTVYVVYSGDNNHESFVNNMSSVIISETELNATVGVTSITYGQDGTITVKLNDTLATGKVSVTVNGTTITQSIGAGETLEFTFEGLVSGSYPVWVSFAADSGFTSFDDTQFGSLVVLVFVLLT